MRRKSEFGRYVSELNQQKELNLTQYEIAEQCGINSAYFSDILRGGRNATDEFLFRLSEILMLTADEETTMFDLAAVEKGGVALDLKEILYYEENALLMREIVRNISDGSLDLERIKNNIVNTSLEISHVKNHVHNKTKTQSGFREYVSYLNQKSNRNLKQKEIAEQCGVSIPYMSHVFCGAIPVSQTVLINISKIFELTAEEEIRLYDLAAINNNSVAPDLKEILYGWDNAPLIREIVRKLGGNLNLETIKTVIFTDNSILPDFPDIDEPEQGLRW